MESTAPAAPAEKVTKEIMFDDGALYRGEIDPETQFMHGQGMLIYADDSVYEGKFVMNKREGKGEFIYPNKDVYKGKFQNGLMHGKGVFSSPDGTYFTGEWKEGKRHGEGLFRGPKGVIMEIWEDGELTFEDKVGM
ncbi:unnamed protein product [Moneuplotes crassus]|uniref:MORN repeat protein n=1 Tax=Euplotes crassus TaxID=5936 RepID=A0AAD2D7L4_EUPCR|nr:unnamed protein product [Moneuplotes crassus]